ncbi:MAG: carbohydrate ABC transporter permease [Egibacteraceae bacterium]
MSSREAAGRQAPQPAIAKRAGLAESRLAKAFLAPSVAVMALVALFPVIYAAVISFSLFLGRTRYGIGIGNYTQAFTSGRFFDSVLATFVFTTASVAFEFLIGLGFALIMHQAFRGRGLTRATILVPWVIPTVVAATMWQYMFNVAPGTVNYFLPFVPADFNWLGQPNTPMFTIIFADVWKTAPFVALLLLAGLQTIPVEVYESSRVDGATAWQRLVRITLPLLKPAILVALLFRTTEALRVFDLPWVMTRGQFGTETLSVLVNEFVVRTVDPGYASALSTLTFGVILAIGALFVSLLGKDLVLGTQE